MTQPLDRSRLFSTGVQNGAYSAQEQYHAHLFEQYKLYVETVDRVSDRRSTANSFFLTLNTALLAFVDYTTKESLSDYVMLVGVAGVAVSLLWFQTVTSYRNLNSAKFRIIHDIEKRLPLNLYDAEWAAMGRGRDPAVYRRLSHIERAVPWVFIALYVYVITRTLT